MSKNRTLDFLAASLLHFKRGDFEKAGDYMAQAAECEDGEEAVDLIDEYNTTGPEEARASFLKAAARKVLAGEADYYNGHIENAPVTRDHEPGVDGKLPNSAEFYGVDDNKFPANPNLRGENLAEASLARLERATRNKLGQRK